MMPNRDAIVVRALTAAAAVASLAHVGILIPRYLVTDAALPLSIRLFLGSIVITVLAALGGSVLALTLVARSWDRPGARSLALFLAAVSALWGSILRLIDISTTPSDVNIQLRASSSLQVFVLASAVIVAAAAFLRFSALFPAPLDGSALPAPRRFRWPHRARVALLHSRPVWLVAAVATLVMVGYVPVGGRLLALVTTGSLDLEAAFAAHASVRRIWIGGIAAVGTITMLILPAAAMILGMRNLAAGYRVAAPDERRRVLWLFAGISIAGWMMLAPLLAIPLAVLTRLSVDWLPFVAGLLWVFAPAVLICAAAVAIFYSGAVDPALVLKRSTIYGILGALAFVLFTALESVLSNFFEATLGMPGTVGSVIAGCVAAGCMIPVRLALRKASTRATRVRDTAIPPAADP